MTDAEAHGVVGAATELGGKLISSLPAQFLVLCLLNVLFIGGVLLFLDRENNARAQIEQHAMDARERVLMPLIASCLREKEPK